MFRFDINIPISLPLSFEKELCKLRGIYDFFA